MIGLQRRTHSHPGEFGAHFLGLLDQASLQHVLSTLRVDEAVGGVQGLGLVHPARRLLYVARVLQRQRELKDLHLKSELSFTFLYLGHIPKGFHTSYTYLLKVIMATSKTNYYKMLSPPLLLSLLT